MKPDIFITLTESARVLNWIGRQTKIERKNRNTDCFSFEIQIPPDMIGHQLALAYIVVAGETFGIRFENFPDDVVAEVHLRKEIAELSEKCLEGCGLSFELFVSRFSSLFDSQYAKSSPEIRDAAIKIAKEHGYSTSAEIEEGLCAHFFDPDCCPLGCGSV